METENEKTRGQMKLSTSERGRTKCQRCERRQREDAMERPQRPLEEIKKRYKTHADRVKGTAAARGKHMRRCHV